MGPGFESLKVHQIWPVGQAVKTPPSHGGIRSSILLRVTISFKENCNRKIVGANGDEVTPVPIPNTEVKLISVENTWLATAREDRAVPAFFYGPLAQLVRATGA